MTVRKSETDQKWLAPVLRRGLRRVKAPEKLWDRVTLPRVEQVREEPRRTFMWMITGASVVAASLVAVAWGYYPSIRVNPESGQVPGRGGYTVSVQRAGGDMRMACLACHVGTTI
jgi:hypothetical protein